MIKQMESHSEPILTTSQNAYIISKDLKYLVDFMRYFLIINLIFLSLGWANTIYQFDETLYVLVYLELSLFSIYFLVVFLVKDPYKKLKAWFEDYVDEGYTLVFNTTIPKGESSGEKIVNLASAIFPQLRQDYEDLVAEPSYKLKLWIKKKIGKSKKQYGIKNFNYKINSDSVDLAAETPEGFFIVKDFRESLVSIDLLKDLIRILTRRFRVARDIPPYIDIFRLVCVSKRYDDPFLNRETLERLMTQELKADFAIDLIMEEKVGYSVLWIGSE